MDKTFILKCDVCSKSFHRSCKKITKKAFRDLSSSHGTYICSHKCFATTLPFYESDNIDFFSALSGEGEYPCGKCHIECLDKPAPASIQCSICDKWYHFVCTNLTKKEFLNDVYFFCSRRCEMYNFPFVHVDTAFLVEDGIFCKSSALTTKKTKSKKRRKITNLNDTPKNVIDTRKFMEVNCSYIKANDINDSFLDFNDIDLTIFQNNIRSLSKNFHLVEEMFKDCSKLPDILSFSETRLQPDSK